jgi:hypothetical protein
MTRLLICTATILALTAGGEGKSGNGAPLGIADGACGQTEARGASLRGGLA